MYNFTDTQNKLKQIWAIMFFKERKKKLAYCFVDSKVHQEEEVVSAKKKSDPPGRRR